MNKASSRSMGMACTALLGVTAAITVLTTGCATDEASPGTRTGETSPTLPEGESFAYITNFDGAILELDPAEVFLGEEAIGAAAEDGAPIDAAAPNGVYVRNPQVSSVRVNTSEALEITLIDNQIIEARPVTPSELGDMYSEEAQPDWLYGDITRLPAIITILHGDAISVAEQYLP